MISILAWEWRIFTDWPVWAKAEFLDKYGVNIFESMAVNIGQLNKWSMWYGSEIVKLFWELADMLNLIKVESMFYVDTASSSEIKKKTNRSSSVVLYCLIEP